MVHIGPINESGPTVQFHLDAIRTAVIGNSSRVQIAISAINTGTTASFYGGAGSQVGAIDGIGDIVSHVANPFLPSGYATGATRWNTVATYDIPHDAAGNHAPITVRMRLAYGSINQQFTAVLDLPRIATVPSQPPPPSFISATTTTIDFNFYNSADNGGSPEIGWDLQSATEPAFTQNLQQWVDYGSPGQATGLIPGTQTYIRYRSVNAIGFGPWSAALTATTLPAVAPGFSVTPRTAGTSADLAFTPPGGVTGVTKYTWERRVAGTTTPVVTADSPTSTVNVGGLTPGQTNEWRASAWIGSYQSPWTAWVAATQPAPNTNPGDYFDGSTPARPDATFSWTGTVNNSVSQAVGKPPTGWLSFASGATVSGGTGAVYQATGGHSSAFSARVIFFSDAGAKGFVSGVAFGGSAVVEPNTPYVGSIHVRIPYRSQVMQAGIRYYTSGGVELTTFWGDPINVAASSSFWTRLSASGRSPSNAASATVVVRDATTGTAWRGGEEYLMDDAMVSLQLYPYFSGSTPDVPEWDYLWLGTPNQSVSQRLPLVVVLTDPLADPDCPPIPTPPMPPTVDSDCIIEVGTWRRYTVVVPASEVGLWSATLPTLILETGAQAERQVRIRVYPNPDEVTPEEIAYEEWEGELILTYVPPNTTLTLDTVAQRVWADVAGRDRVGANELLYGTGGLPPTWPELRCGIAYVITLDVPLDAPEGNLTTQLLLTQRM